MSVLGTSQSMFNLCQIHQILFFSWYYISLLSKHLCIEVSIWLFGREIIQNHRLWDHILWCLALFYSSGLLRVEKMSNHMDSLIRLSCSEALSFQTPKFKSTNSSKSLFEFSDLSQPPSIKIKRWCIHSGMWNKDSKTFSTTLSGTIQDATM